jgi:hypothetical protein
MGQVFFEAPFIANLGLWKPVQEAANCGHSRTSRRGRVLGDQSKQTLTFGCRERLGTVALFSGGRVARPDAIPEVLAYRENAQVCANRPSGLAGAIRYAVLGDIAGEEIRETTMFEVAVIELLVKEALGVIGHRFLDICGCLGAPPCGVYAGLLGVPVSRMRGNQILFCTLLIHDAPFY